MTEKRSASSSSESLSRSGRAESLSASAAADSTLISSSGSANTETSFTEEKTSMTRYESERHCQTINLPVKETAEPSKISFPGDEEFRHSAFRETVSADNFEATKILSDLKLQNSLCAAHPSLSWIRVRFGTILQFFIQFYYFCKFFNTCIN